MLKISVVIPTYNRSNYICAAVESVLNQTYQDYEIIVVDDGSTDSTQEILKKYKSRIKYFYKERGGMASARNLGIQKSEGDCLIFLDSDDELKPQMFNKAITYLASYDCVIFGQEVLKIDEKGEVYHKSNVEFFLPHLKTGNLAAALFKHDHLGGIAKSIFQKNCFKIVGFFDENIPHEVVDWDFWIRFTLSPKRIIILNDPLYIYKIFDSIINKKNDFEFRRNCLLGDAKVYDKHMSFFLKKDKRMKNICSLKFFSLFLRAWNMEVGIAIALKFLFKSFIYNPFFCVSSLSSILKKI